ncbi:MAG TPA: BTAD domain-containing putative transcriptional regulator [Gaiellaceae bacterium]|nr:BTAD domain-containing putative transcriptional regulator [Gaiellaceae bacterium]
MPDDCPIERLRKGSGSGARLVIRVLGPLLVQDGSRTLGPRDFGGARPKQVLEILLAARGHSVPVDRLAELLWGEDPPQNAAGSLQTFVSVLRRHLSPGRDRARQLVVTESEAYRFATEDILFDLDRFDELLEGSARQPTRAARVSLEQALDLVRGEAFEDEPYASWATELRGSYHGRVLGARLDAADLALAELDHSAALAHTESATVLDRFSERAHRTEMLALYALGRGHEALDRYRAFRLRLDHELGLEPTAETRALEAAILRQDDVHSLLPRPIHRPQSDGDGRSVYLIGRTGELETISASAREALRGNLAMIQIEGAAGLGKTRLLEEMQRLLRGTRIGRASASQLESHLPYVPLATALRDALAGVDLDRRRLGALGQILPELTLGDPRQGVEEVEVLEALVAVVADHAPLALLIDDLQWADRETIAALAYLQRRGADVRCALITTARLAEAPADHPLRRLKPDVIVRLEPLSAAELAPLGILNLHEWTGGNPRYIAAALADGRPSEPSRTIAEALIAQCRAEGPWGWRVLVAASLLEQPFDPEPLAELLGTDPAALTEELERLCQQRILRIDGLRFRFGYEVLRRALLGSISPARQRLLKERLQAGRIHAVAPPSAA